ncbi:MAG TPA: helicase-related protein [Thermoanaerobaculia bacterium]|nr:helicase-related protein [Thermoanaerobaculia bacterium]
MSFEPGAIVSARGRHWVVLPDSDPDLLLLRPLGGRDDEVAGVHLGLETVEPAALAPPVAGDLGDFCSGRLLRDAVRLSFRSSAGPFRSFGRIACEPRPYQLVPLLMALKLDPVRLLIADDVGIGKTVEAALVVRELLDRGEIHRFTVLCPPHLAEQWQAELLGKFHLEAELVLSATARRLEAGCGLDESIFDRHPATIVSTDFIKSDRRRQEFLRSAPELVVVDEAHTCAASGEQRSSRHQRHELLRSLAADSSRHLLLVTATPHSGKDEAFRSLLALLGPELANLPEDLGGDHNRRHRERLAAHLVQRRRGRIDRYLGAETPFPRREELEETYRLGAEARRFFDKVLAFAKEVVSAPEGGVRQRVRWWSAIALLRSIGSSPAAAAATLRNRAAGLDAETPAEVDEAARLSVLDAGEDDPLEAVDLAPGADAETDPAPEAPLRRRLLALAREADALQGAKDAKLTRARGLIGELVEAGYSPIVFCRFIPTAEYLAGALRKSLPAEVEVDAVTGLLAPEEREARVQALGQASRRVLVATDCLSEGINLQQSFDAVVHYDLSWSPTRHEQREGRVDRYGQRSPFVRVLTYYGQDNPIDGAVLDVLLRKQRTIRSRLGISVPVPADPEAVVEALLSAGLLSGQPEQLTFEDFLPSRETLHRDWEQAAERESQSRSLFAQEGIRDEEVFREVEAAQRAVGSGTDLECFVREALAGYRVPAEGTSPVRFLLQDLPASVADALKLPRESSHLKVRFAPPVGQGEHLLVRTDPLVEGLAGHVLASALDPQLPDRGPARRAGVVRTRAVTMRTTVVVLRLRLRLTERLKTGEHSTLAEEALLAAFEGAPSAAVLLPPERAEELLTVTPDANVAPEVAEIQIGRVLAEPDALAARFADLAAERAAQLADSHERVRQAARGSAGGAARGRVLVEPLLPVDLLGVYVFLPGAV